LRILHVVPSYYPAVRYGGPILSVRSLAQAQARRGDDVHVYTTNVDGQKESNVPVAQPVDDSSVRVWYFPTGIGRRLYRSPEMARALWNNLRSFDVVHLHSVFLWPTSAAAHVARTFGVPYLLAPRGMLVRELIDRKSTLIKRAWIMLLDRRNVERAAAVHATSAVEAEEILALGLHPRAIVTVANGVEIPDQQAKAGTACRDRYILFLGRVNWKKGLDRLIPAMRQVSGARLLIAGNDEENYRPQLELLARQSGVADKLEFVGPVYGEDKWALVRGAEMLVLPSYSENFGIVALEAMACGCPVVLTSKVGMAGVVDETGAGAVIDGPPEELGRAIAKLLANPDARRVMGESGRRVARERFSWDAIACEMDQAYRACRVGERHAATG
jgi:glycosyltransferase involved in cell wall biosynthesis